MCYMICKMYSNVLDVEKQFSRKNKCWVHITMEKERADALRSENYSSIVKMIEFFCNVSGIIVMCPFICLSICICLHIQTCNIGQANKLQSISLDLFIIHKKKKFKLTCENSLRIFFNFLQYLYQVSSK
jgi:hypothetical protein